MEDRNVSMYVEKFGGYVPKEEQQQAWMASNAEIQKHTTAGKSSKEVNAIGKLTFCQPVWDLERREVTTVFKDGVPQDTRPMTGEEFKAYSEKQVAGPFGDPLYIKACQADGTRKKIVDPKDTLRKEIQKTCPVTDQFEDIRRATFTRLEEAKAQLKKAATKGSDNSPSRAQEKTTTE